MEQICESGDVKILETRPVSGQTCWSQSQSRSLETEHFSSRSQGQNYFDLHFNLDVNISVRVGLRPKFWSESDSGVSARTRYRSGELAVGPVVGLV